MGIQNKDGALYFATGVDNTGLYSGRREAIGIIKAMTGEITSFDVFGGIGISAAMAFAKASKDAYDFEKQFQKSMYEVATISSTISGNLTDYMNQVVEVTKKIPVAANDAAKALYQIVSAGHDGADAMKILEVSAKTAIGGVTDTATSADAITTILNAYKMSASEAEKVSDMLFTTARLGKTNMSELGKSIAQAAPIAASYGVEIDQVLAAVASLTKQGTPTAQAMTQIRAAIIGTSKVLGDGAFNTRTFQEALEEVANRSKGSESKLRELVPEIEAVNGVLGMTGKNAKNAASDLEELGNSTGASEAAFKKMNETADAQLQLLQNNITNTLRPLGEGILKEVVGAAKKMNDAFTNGDMESSLQTLETLIKLVSVAFVGYKVATMDSLKIANLEAGITTIQTTLKQAYHKTIGDGIIQKEKDRLAQEAYTASLEGSLTAEQLSTVEKQNLKKGSKEYANALSDVAVNAKKSADMEVESISKALNKNKDRLSATKERLSISQEATKAAKLELNSALKANDIAATEVAQTKLASAAKREESAATEVNTISRRINSQERQLSAARTTADTAATVINNATTAGNTVATNFSSQAHNFLAAAKLKVAIATRTLTAAIAANPIGALLTVVSLAASAMLLFGSNTEKAKTKLQEFNDEQARLKETTDNLINTLYDTNESEQKRMEALLQLRSIYPDIYKNITLENLALKERNTLLKATNTLRGKEAEANLKNQIANAQKRIEEIRGNPDNTVTTPEGKKMNVFSSSQLEEIEELQIGLKGLKQKYLDIQVAKQKLLEDSWPADVQISIYEKELKDLEDKIKEVKSKIGEATTAKKEFSLTDWGELPKFDIPLFEAKFSLEDSINLQFLEKQAEEVQAKLNKAKESKNPQKKTGTNTILTDAEKQAAEKRKNALEEIENSVLNVEINLQKEKIAIMSDGRKKALAEIEAEKRERLKELDDEEKKLKEKYKSVGKSMPANVYADFSTRRQVVNDNAAYKTGITNKDYDRKEIEFQKELSSVFLTEEEKRQQAVQDRYDEMRKNQNEAYENELRNIQLTMKGDEAWNATVATVLKYADVFSKIDNAQMFEESKDKKKLYDSLIAQLTDFKSQEEVLTKEWNDKIADATTTGDTDLVERMKAGKEKALNELNVQMLMQSDEWVKLFGNMDNLTVSELDNLIKMIKSKAKDMKLDPINLDKVIKGLEQAEEKIRTINPFKKLIDHIKEYKKAEDDATKKSSLKDIFKDVSSSLSLVKSGLDSVVGGLKDMGIAGDEETQNLLGSISNMVGSASELASGIATMNPASMISGAVGLISSAFDVFDSRSRKANREIKKHAENLKELQKQYRELERATNKAIGEDKYKGQIEQARNYQKQIGEISGMISAEQSKRKKKRDDGKIDEWKNQIEDLKDNIEEIKQGIIDELSTTDIYSYANGLATSIVDGFCDGIDDATGIIDDKMKELLRNVISKQFDVMVVQKAMKPMFDAMAAGFDIDSEDGFGLSDRELDKIVSAGEQGKAQVSNSLDSLKKVLERLGLISDEVTDELEDGVTGKLNAAMTEGTANELVGLWNMTAMDLRSLLNLSASHFSESKNCWNHIYDILEQTKLIVTNTGETSQNTKTLIDKVESGLKDVKEELSEIKKNTKTYNSRG